MCQQSSPWQRKSALQRIVEQRSKHERSIKSSILDIIPLGGTPGELTGFPHNIATPPPLGKTPSPFRTTPSGGSTKRPHNTETPKPLGKTPSKGITKDPRNTGITKRLQKAAKPSTESTDTRATVRRNVVVAPKLIHNLNDADPNDVCYNPIVRGPGRPSRDGPNKLPCCGTYVNYACRVSLSRHRKQYPKCIVWKKQKPGKKKKEWENEAVKKVHQRKIWKENKRAERKRKNARPDVIK